MDWLNIHTSVLDSAEFVTADPVDRATWLMLQRHCCGQENGGRIIGAKAWGDRVWQQLCGVTLAEVQHKNGLWDWDGEDLLVRFYNTAAEEKLHRLRSQAAQAGHASWHSRSRPRRKANGLPDGEPDGSTTVNPSGSPSVEPSGSPIVQPKGNAKRKERKGKEIKGNVIKGNTPNPQGPESLGLNGSHPGPNRNRPRKSGSVLPDEQPEPIRSRMLTTGALLGRQASTAWTRDEFEAFGSTRLDCCPDDEFIAQHDALRAYYHATIPREMDYRRRDLLRLLRHWPGELDRARTFRREHDDGIQKP